MPKKEHLSDDDDLTGIDSQGRTADDHNREKIIYRRKLRQTEGVRKAEQATSAEKIAVGLSIFPNDIEKAASIVGLGGLDLAEIKKLCRTARKHHKDIISGDPAAIVRLSNEVLLLCLLSLRETVGLISPTILATTIKQVAGVKNEYLAQHPNQTEGSGITEDGQDDVVVLFRKPRVQPQNEVPDLPPALIAASQED